MLYNTELFNGHLNDYISTITQHIKGKYYVCPLCQSGSKGNRGAFAVRNDGKTWKCYSCGAEGDIFDLYAAINNCTTSDAMDSLARIYMVPSEMEQNIDTADKEHEQKVYPDVTPSSPYKEAIERWADALPGSAAESSLAGMGLTKDTMQRFMLGTDGTHVIIPYDEDCTYYAKLTIDGQKYSYLDDVKVPLFNPAALYRCDICYVVASPLHAISIEQCGQPAVALSGVRGVHRLMHQLSNKPAKVTFLICLDNDKGKATEALAAFLEGAGFTCMDAAAVILGSRDTGGYKDPIDVLQADPAELTRRLQYAADECRRIITADADKEAQERAITSGPDSIDAFLRTVQTERYKPIPTGIRDIDAAIGGGLIRQQLVLLGAAPGAGKTALAQWIFETMAREGQTDILYLNFEMSREQMLARSIARTAKRNGLTIKTTDVLQGYKWTRDQRATVIAAADLYKRTIAPHISYNPDGITADLDTIIGCIEREAMRAETAGKMAPICVIDYLQIISGAPREDAVETIKRAVMAFKDYAVRHQTIVFVIMATNRDSNKSGDVTMESGRDTSALEYSADLQLGLAFTRCLDRPEQPRKKKDELTSEDKAYKTLRITKGRFGGEGTEVDLYFDGESMSYTQIVMWRS